MDTTQLVIVALASETDPVQKYSSEKAPHLTLLYLGENKYTSEQLTHITEFVEHAASLLPRFGLGVEKRGELGENKADVLFFNKNWSTSIATFRSQLLQDPLISTAYHSTDQFPEWAPHLTMGFPDSPAKKDDREFPEFHWVSFDRVALWTGDSTGPTFELKTDDYAEIAMSAIDLGRAVVENSLTHAISDFNLEDEYGDLLDLIEENLSELDGNPVEHSGVKGMKWGIRKDRPSSTREPLKSLGPDSVSRKTASGETITLKKVPPSQIHKVFGRISKGYREGYSKQASLSILDGKGKKVGDANVTKKSDEELNLEWLGIDKSARGKGYATAVMKAGRDFGKQQGFKRMTLEVPGNSPDARHIYEKIGFKVTKEADSTDDFWGGLTEMAYEFDVAQSALIHYGVKGMKWGVRRDDSGGGSSASQPRASSDAKLADSTAAKIQSGGTRSVSNTELQGLITRMNLERQYSSMAVQQQNSMDKGLQTTQRILKAGKTVEDVRRFLETPTGKAVKTGLKGAFAAAKVAAAYATGGTSAAAGAAGTIAVRRMSNHYTNVG